MELFKCFENGNYLAGARIDGGVNNKDRFCYIWE